MFPILEILFSLAQSCYVFELPRLGQQSGLADGHYQYLGLAQYGKLFESVDDDEDAYEIIKAEQVSDLSNGANSLHNHNLDQNIISSVYYL